MHAAQSGLQPLLNHIPPEDRQDFGFSNDDDMATAVLGSPFNLFTITPEDLAGYRKGTPVSSILRKTDLWYFPVVVNKSARTILIVDKVGGKWRAVSLGNTHLVKTLQQVSQRWPEAGGFTPRLIAVFQARQYLVTVPEVDERSLMPVPDGLPGGGNLKVDGAESLIMEDAYEVMQRLLPIVTENIGNQ
ncbi:MAG: hypothetical protein Kow0089_18360 [Desulfobulbaceae bacterium]